MSLIKKFNEAGQEIGTENIPLDASNLNSYVQQYNTERGEGYLDALSDFVQQIANIIETPEGLNTAPIVRRELKKFLK